MMDMNQGMNPYGTPMPSATVGAGGGDFMNQLQQWFQGQQNGGNQMPGRTFTGGQIAGPQIPLSAGQSPNVSDVAYGMSPQQMQQVAGGGAPGAGGGLPPSVNWSQIMQQITGGAQQPPSAPPNYSPAGGYGTMTTNMQAPQNYAMDASRYGGGASMAGQSSPTGAPGFGATTKPASFDPNAVPGGQFASGGGQQASQFNPGSAQGFAGSWMNALPSASGNPSYSNKMQAY